MFKFTYNDFSTLLKTLQSIVESQRTIIAQNNKLIEQGEKQMASTQDILDAIAALRQSDADEKVRIDSIIALLSAHPEDPNITEALSQLQQMKADADAAYPTISAPAEPAV